MDVKGARILTERIAEQQWRLAESVQRGEQPATDPDFAHLDEVGDSYRLYTLPSSNGSPSRRVKKVLVDGSWRIEDDA